MLRFFHLSPFRVCVQEAWHEYQDELSYDSTERHAILIQAYARGMRSRSDTARMRLQQDKILMIQRMVRGKLARKYLRRIKMQYKYAAFMASRERKAVMKLEVSRLPLRQTPLCLALRQPCVRQRPARFLSRKCLCLPRACAARVHQAA